MSPRRHDARARFRGRRAAQLLFLAALSTACARAPFPRLEPRAFPFAVDTLRTRMQGDGARYHFVYSPTGPWAIHALEVRLDRCLSPVAVKGGRSAIGRRTTSELLTGLDSTRDVIGGVNADFFLFTPPGVPTGAHVTRGRVITPPGRQPAFAIDSSGRPRIEVLWSVRPDTFAVDDPRLTTLRLLPFHPREAVGGRPLLLRDSAFAPTVDTEGQAGFANGRHPRTAVGIADGGRRLLLVVVDGRQKPYSDGMTLRELARVMLAFGAPDALNLDGGGSTAMVLADPGVAGTMRVVNKPSDPTGERAVANALAIVRECERR
jgi:hypothetical protein